MSTVQPHELVTFGSFEVDLHTGEVRKYGMRVRLQGQPFRVLTALLAKPGEVVTREELQLQIWGEHTTVDFERGIATAMSKLREALGDSADHPRYIETLSKRGFRFIAPVLIEPAHELPSPIRIPPFAETAPPVVVEAPPQPAPVNVSPVAQPSPVVNLGSDRQRRLAWPLAMWLAGAALVLVALSSLLTLALTRPHRPLHPSRVEQLTQSGEIYYGPPNPENLLTLATDGPRLFTSFLTTGWAGIGSLDLGGTAPEMINMPDELRAGSIADISRDGAKMIVRGRNSRESEQPLWIVPAGGSSALRVGDVLAHDATFMPDGESVLYATGNELDVVHLASGATQKFAGLTGRAFWLRWSPTQRFLRFTLFDPVTHVSSLWDMDAATHRLRPLDIPELKAYSLCCGSWSADGSVYVFAASDKHGSDIWALGAGPHPALTQITNGPLSYISPLPSRTDRTVYFVGLNQPAGTRVLDEKLHQFVPAPSFLEHARRLTYSRDGRWVAWVDVDGRLWRAWSQDGSKRLQLTPDTLDVFLAKWSADQSRLVVMAREPGETWQIYIVNAEGGTVHKLLADRRNLADPDWSADDRQIVFGREGDLMGKENGPRNLQMLELQTLTTKVIPGSENLFSPRWSPDGRWIVALSLDQTRLLLYNVQAHTWSTLATGSAADPVWSLDSKSVYFHAFADPKSAILRVSVNGGAAEPVADLSDLAMPRVDSYFFSGITPWGAPVILPRVGTGNLFATRLSE